MSDREELMRFFHGNQDAVELAFMLAKLAHTWDDLIDKDKPVADEEINYAFWLALVAIPSNAFYVKWGAALRPVMGTAILNWVGANAMEKRGSVEDLEIAHVTRYSVADVLLLMATLIGGAEWGFACAADIRRLAQKNAFREYFKEHSA